MKISGLQKTTLLDFPQKVACTVFTPNCNFRCPFCHNASLVEQKMSEIPLSEFFDFLNKRKNLLDGVCITGGEPLLQTGIVDFIKQIKDLGLLVKLDTNGSFPALLSELLSQNLLDYVAMDIKNSKQNYAKTVGCEKNFDISAIKQSAVQHSKDFDVSAIKQSAVQHSKNFDISTIEQSVDILLNCQIDYEFRTTVVKGLHTLDDLISIAKWISQAKLFALQKFQYSPDLICGDGLSAFSDTQMKHFFSTLKPLVKNLTLRGVN